MASSRIFVKGLPPNITESDLRKHFSSKNREITDIKLIPQRRIGYVGYKTPDVASTAVKYFNRSYIRMSKIAVEIARPISDATPSRDKDGSGIGRHPRIREAPPPETDNDLNSKKRKREVLDKSDPKLREFIEVMKPGREGVMAEQNAIAAGTGVPEQADVHHLENDSDNEYEQLPAPKLRRQDNYDRSQADLTTGPIKASSPEVKPDATIAAETADEGNSAEDAPILAATDDDWLRSRTNRILDLVDPTELAPQATEQTTHELPDQTEDNKEIQTDTPSETNHDGAPAGAENEPEEHGVDTTKEGAIRQTSRLFVRNLPYSATEGDIWRTFEKFGTILEVQLPCNASGTSKGFAMVLFADPSDAVEAFHTMDGGTFQGRIMHVIPANSKRELGLDEFGISKLPLKKQNLIRKKAEAASSTFNWNALYMNQDAVNASVANRLGVSKSELLDPTSADAAVKQAIAETTIIQETKAYFAANGVDLDAFKSHRRGDMSILVKNFPFGTTIEELRKLFEEFGPVLRVLMPPSGTIAIVQFTDSKHAKMAFGRLAYRRIKDSVLFLEKAPKDLFISEPADTVPMKQGQPGGQSKLNVDDLLSRGNSTEEDVQTTSLFVRNLNFTTTTSRLAEAFESLDGFVSARVKTKTDAKKPGQTLSMGFGFVEFRTKDHAQAALKVMDGSQLEGHRLAVKASHKGHDAAEERRREDKARKAAGQRTKIVIKNLPFQATKKDVRALFGTYGQLRSIRVPKKVDYTSRGFAFADFITPREAENALNALRDTHLLGRRLVLDFAEAEAVDAEEEIEKMQRKVGGQVNKIALQQLTGGGRKRVNIGNNEEELEG